MIFYTPLTLIVCLDGKEPNPQAITKLIKTRNDLSNPPGHKIGEI